MKQVTLFYNNAIELEKDIREYDIVDSNKLLIQVFTSQNDYEYIQNIQYDLNNFFPLSHIIGSTTDGEIKDGKVYSDTTVLSFTIFDKTSILTSSIEHSTDSFNSGISLAKELRHNSSKLFIIFGDSMNTNGEELLNGISSVDDSIVVSGGLAGDSNSFTSSYVFTKFNIISNGVVGVSLNSYELNVYRKYNFDWEKIGKELTVTKAYKNRVYTLDDISAVDTYKHYLGKCVSDNLPKVGIEFPLIINRNGKDIARAVISKESDGSLMFAGNINEGDIVRFGYGDAQNILKNSRELKYDVANHPSEVIFVYSCMARKHFLDGYAEQETLPLNQISPTIGFFTYGEFFTTSTNEFFNETLTIISLSETDDIVEMDFEIDEQCDLKTSSIDALTHLLNVTSSELFDEYENSKHQADVFEYFANHDSLTKLYNRTFFNQYLETLMDKSNDETIEFALLFLDLDRFKEINDSFGHNTGDEVLKVVSKRIKKVISSKPILCRVGGDEFNIIIENINSEKDIEIICKNILSELEHPIIVDAHKFYISGSIGIAMYPKHNGTLLDLIKFADTAMFKAKELGKNNCQFYSSDMTEEAIERSELDVFLRDAIKNNEFHLVYQPQVNALNKEIIGVETLIRWVHDGKFIPPDKFICIAENNGYIHEIDRWVMKHAMEEINRWYKQGIFDGNLSVNVSIKELQRDDFLDNLKSILHMTNFNPKKLEIELTESVMIKNAEKIIEILNKVSDLGIKISIDDFGTGYSSISYLTKLPLTKLKIDKSFIQEIFDSKESELVVKTIIGLSKGLNLDLIAEGVEEESERNFLIKHECTNIQGYFYSRPLKSIEIIKYLQENIL
jgi:c-di-GMP phosphodiesterase